MKHLLYFNGIDAPLLDIFGCTCARCQNHNHQANVSASLITLDDEGQTINHMLFDCGSGVVDQLVRNPYLQGDRARLDHILLTHWHRDHIAELNRLLVSWHLSYKHKTGSSAARTPLWCRSGTAAWLRRYYDYELDNYLALQESQEQHPPGTLLAPLTFSTLPDIVLTPITLSHLTADLSLDRQDTMYCCSGFIIETAAKKVALLWDMDNINHWLTHPQTAAHQAAIAKLQHADHIFIDTSFWYNKPKPASHASFETVINYIRPLRPRQTWLIHLSGHPDAFFTTRNGTGAYGWSNEKWTAEAQKAWAEHGLEGNVQAAYARLSIPL